MVSRVYVCTAPVLGSTADKVPINIQVACSSFRLLPDNDNEVMGSFTATCKEIYQVLFVKLASPELCTYHVNLNICHCTHVVGTTGIETPSKANGAIIVVFVHVTVLAGSTTAPQVQPLDVNQVVGPFTHEAIVNLISCCPVAPVSPTFVVLTGIYEVVQAANVGTGCHTPGTISGLLTVTYGTSLHCVVDVYTPGAVPKSQLIPYP